MLQDLDVKDDYEDVKHKAKQHKPNLTRIKTKQDAKSNTEEPKINHNRERRQTSINVPYANLDDLLAEKSSLDLIPDWDGYYIGDVWSAQRSKNRQRVRSRQRDNANSYAQRPSYQNVDNQG